MSDKYSISTRVLILGGGFGGVYTACAALQKSGANDPTVEITLVSRNNYFLMTPLLFEAGSGILDPRHVVNPIRPLFENDHIDLHRGRDHHDRPRAPTGLVTRSAKSV